MYMCIYILTLDFTYVKYYLTYCVPSNIPCYCPSLKTLLFSDIIPPTSCPKCPLSVSCQAEFYHRHRIWLTTILCSKWKGTISWQAEDTKGS